MLNQVILNNQAIMKCNYLEPQNELVRLVELKPSNLSNI
jgi:hypothetical protein